MRGAVSPLPHGFIASTGTTLLRMS